MGWATGTLFVTGEAQVHPALRLAGRNIPGVEFKPVSDLNVHDLVKWRRVILDVPAVQVLERTLSKGWVHVLEEPGASQAVDLPIFDSSPTDATSVLTTS